MEVQLLYHQATPNYLSCLRGDGGWGTGEKEGSDKVGIFLNNKTSSNQ
jgi:hypothetical protein